MCRNSGVPLLGSFSGLVSEEYISSVRGIYGGDMPEGYEKCQ